MGEKDAKQSTFPSFEKPEESKKRLYENPLLNKENQSFKKKEFSPKPRDLVDLIKTETKFIKGEQIKRHHLPNSSLVIEGDKNVAALMVLDEKINGPQAKSLTTAMKEKDIHLSQVRAVLKHNENCKSVQEAINFCSDPKNKLDIIHYANLFKDIQGIDDRFHN